MSGRIPVARRIYAIGRGSHSLRRHTKLPPLNFRGGSFIMPALYGILTGLRSAHSSDGANAREKPTTSCYHIFVERRRQRRRHEIGTDWLHVVHPVREVECVAAYAVCCEMSIEPPPDFYIKNVTYNFFVMPDGQIEVRLDFAATRKKTHEMNATEISRTGST